MSGGVTAIAVSAAISLLSVPAAHATTQSGVTERVSISSAGVQSNNTSRLADISDDGQRVAFASTASNLVAGDTNAREDVFVRDLSTGTTSLASLTDTGGQVTTGLIVD